MITVIEGTVAARKRDHIVIMVGGVGLEIIATRSAMDQSVEGSRTSLLTRLIVREDNLSLYGFSNETEREMFDILLKISGVGPRMAIAILSTLTLDNLRGAVVAEKVDIITRVPGVGRKTAQKILLELKDKFPQGLDAIPETAFDDINSDVMDALVALGFSVVEAQMAIQALPADAPSDTEERVRISLQYLSR